MRILSRVLTWHAADTTHAPIITYLGDQRHVDLLLKRYGLEHGRSQGKNTLRDKTTFLGTNPLAGAYLPADGAQTFKSRCMRNLFIALDRPDVQFTS